VPLTGKTGAAPACENFTATDVAPVFNKDTKLFWSLEALSIVTAEVAVAPTDTAVVTPTERMGEEVTAIRVPLQRMSGF
jgi:hypothetical protein